MVNLKCYLGKEVYDKILNFVEQVGRSIISKHQKKQTNLYNTDLSYLGYTSNRTYKDKQEESSAKEEDAEDYEQQSKCPVHGYGSQNAGLSH